MCAGVGAELALASAPFSPVSAPGAADSAAPTRGPRDPSPLSAYLQSTFILESASPAHLPAPQEPSAQESLNSLPHQSLSSPRRACAWRSVSFSLWTAAPALLAPTRSSPRTLLCWQRKEPVAFLSLRKSGEALEPQRRSRKRPKPLEAVPSEARGASQEQASSKVRLSNLDSLLTANSLLGLLPGILF